MTVRYLGYRAHVHWGEPASTVGQRLAEVFRTGVPKYNPFGTAEHDAAPKGLIMMRHRKAGSTGEVILAVIRSSRILNPRKALLITGVSLIASIHSATPGWAATFSQASLAKAIQLCESSSGSLPSTSVCSVLDAPGSGSSGSSGIGSFVTPTSSIVALRLQGKQKNPQPGGASPDVVEYENGLSVFFSAGAEQLDHHNNRYEDGYDSQIPTVTVGLDYQFTSWLFAGIAFNYYNFSGNYDDGGRFNTNSIGPIVYLNVLPFTNAFAQVTLGYARKDYYRTRRGFVTGPSGESTGGGQQGGSSGNELNTSLLLGYDVPIDNFTVGPRFGLNYVGTQVDDYREHGDTGLELRYSGQDQSSLQSSLGALATVAIATSWGVLLPQASASWVHDYAIGGRNIQASYVSDPSNSQFTFKTEPVAENFANLGLGISAQLSNSIQPFVTFRTIQGNDNLVSYGGSLGVRVPL